ncbi:hypothetical protein [Umezawaea beigongshangensis]|uniref:hypothetical protein n=1 Tax=Umezawaea beigongshangensis TaxID=2780383 RepID=UPI0018F1A3C6|nr:hypothetical protein [Umezawaea beigongshangensis]
MSTTWWRALHGPGRTTASEHHRTPFAAALPSAVSGVDFRVSWTVLWWLDVGDGDGEPDHAAPESAALNGVYQRALPLGAASAPRHAELLRHQLADQLGRTRAIEETGVRVQAHDVRVELTAEHAALAERHAELLGRRGLRDAERELEAAEIRHLGEHALADERSALLWWLHHNGNDVARAASLLDDLRSLVRVVGEGEDWATALVTALEAAAPGLSDHRRWGLHQQVRKVLEVYADPVAVARFDACAVRWDVGAAG